MRSTHLFWIAFGTLLLIVEPVAADVRLATLFSDHMVLQREKAVPVWGWADAGEPVVVDFGGQHKETKANGNGKWLVTLDAMPANSEPRQLIVRSVSGDSRLAVSDVLVGEVWLGSGQSNMAMTVSRAQDFEKEQKNADLPLIRMFREASPGSPEPRADATGTWSVCSPDTVGAFSATLFFFGREIHRQLKVPVGLINSSVGGTPIESWISAEAQAKNPKLKAFYESEAKRFGAVDEAAVRKQYAQALERWKQRAERARAAGQQVPRKPADPLEQRRRRSGPGGLFNGKISPLIPYAIRGVVWYQGEANSHPGKGYLYRYQLPALVNDWRSRWGEELPFAWVQLPNFQREGQGWMLVREAMLKALELPHTGMAITIDIGEPKNIHPKNKQEVGRRLALWALGDVYGRDGVATSGPLPSGWEIRGNQIVLSFSHCDGGLQAKGGELQGFMIAGEDRQWKPAQARIDGDRVIVWNPDVTKPAAARYAWDSNPTCNLYNGAGLPATPFRTDDWPVENGAGG